MNRWTTGRRSWLAIAAVIVLAAIIYRPWQAIPLPVSDWGGMLPILTEEPTILARFHGLTEMQAREGRYQPAFLAAIALTWSAVGADTSAWQWIRFAVMMGILIGFIALALRLGASKGATAAVALLLVLSGMGQQSWVVPQLPEPRGTLVLLCAALLAVGYGTSQRWPVRATGIVASLVLSILYKETFIAAVPFVLALALWARNDGRWIVRPPTKRDLVLIAATVLTIGVVNVIPVLSVRRLADAYAYGGQYDISSVSFAKLRNVLSALFLPVTRVWWFPANVAFLAALIAGVMLGIRQNGRSALMSVGVLLSLSLAGVVTYLPWSATEGYYALAFLPGLVGLFALALTWLWQSHVAIAKPIAVASCGLLLVYGTLVSSNYVNAYRASRVLEERTARALDGLGGGTLIAAVPSPATSGSFAKGLRGYALALWASDVPQGTDVACSDAARLVAQRAPVIVVVFSTFCGSEAVSDAAPTSVIRESYVTRNWKTFGRSHHEVSVRIWATPTPSDLRSARDRSKRLPDVRGRRVDRGGTRTEAIRDVSQR